MAHGHRGCVDITVLHHTIAKWECVEVLPFTLADTDLTASSGLFETVLDGNLLAAAEFHTLLFAIAIKESSRGEDDSRCSEPICEILSRFGKAADIFADVLFWWYEHKIFGLVAEKAHVVAVVAWEISSSLVAEDRTPEAVV